MVLVQSRFPNGIDLGNGAIINAAQFGGQVPTGILRVPANVAGAETVVIGSDTYRFAAVATDSTKTTSGGQLNNTKDTINDFYMPAHGLIVGDLIRVATEYCRVSGVRNANYIHLVRGVSGSTIAARADALQIFTEATPGVAGILVGLNATFTPVVGTAALTVVINDPNTGIEKVLAVNSDANTIIVMGADRKGGAPISSALATATTETLAGASNAWDNTTLVNGAAPGVVQHAYRVPTANEVTKGDIWFSFPFVPTVLRVKVITTSTQAAKAWDGVSAVVGTRVKLDNSGAVDWAVTDTIELAVRG